MQYDRGRLVSFIVIMLMMVKSHAASYLDIPANHARSFDLHRMGFYICGGIAIIVFLVLIFSLVNYRYSKGTHAVHYHKRLRWDILWATIPFIILVLLVIPAADVFCCV